MSADPSRSRHRGGTDLGLSIVDATVSAHGGAVEIDSAGWPWKWVVAGRAEGHSSSGGTIRQRRAGLRRENEERHRPGSRRHSW
jgi:signal transduction histidine kinase